MKAYVQTFFQIAFTGASFMDSLDLGLRILCGITSLILFYFAIRAHISKKRLSDLEYRIRERDLNERIKSNGQSHDNAHK